MRDQSIPDQQLRERLRHGERTTVLALRSGLECRRGRVPGAVHLPFWQIPWRGGRLPVER